MQIHTQPGVNLLSMEGRPYDQARSSYRKCRPLGKQHVTALVEAGHTVVASDLDKDKLASTFQSFNSEKVIIEELNIIDEQQIRSIARNTTSTF